MKSLGEVSILVRWTVLVLTVGLSSGAAIAVPVTLHVTNAPGYFWNRENAFGPFSAQVGVITEADSYLEPWLVLAPYEGKTVSVDVTGPFELAFRFIDGNGMDSQYSCGILDPGLAGGEWSLDIGNAELTTLFQAGDSYTVIRRYDENISDAEAVVWVCLACGFFFGWLLASPLEVT
jgi:hypothetical protein